MKADLHFHTTLSDGLHAPELVAENLAKVRVKFAALTDHDLISTDFPAMLHDIGIDSVPAGEVSTHFVHPRKISIHTTAYAQRFQDDVHEMVAATRTGKMTRVREQVKKLIQAGYDISYDGLLVWAAANGYSPSSISNPHLANYIYSLPSEKVKADRDQKRSQPNYKGFMADCLKDGRNPIGYVEIPEYEPIIATAANKVQKSGGFLSIAHPNFSWGKYDGIAGLQRDIGHLVEQGVEGIELNALADAEWAKVILEIRDRYNLLLTFGSDNHGETEPSKKHGTLGQMNPYFLEDEKRAQHHMRLFRKRLEV